MKASLDIETAGVEPAGAAVVSVGIVMFDDEKVYDLTTEAGYWRLDPRWVPGRRDKSTHEWWQAQREDLRLEAFGGVGLPWAFCEEFSAWIADNQPEEVWGNGARFDVGHLRELYHQTGHAFPFGYKIERDLPTLRALAQQRAAQRGESDSLKAKIKTIYDSNSAEHNALADAVEQAHSIRMMTQYLRF